MRFTGHAYDPLGSLTFFLIKNVIYMTINPPSSPGLRRAGEMISEVGGGTGPWGPE